MQFALIDTEDKLVEVCSSINTGIIAIDTEFDEDSYNAIANRVVTRKFDSVDSDISDEITARENADSLFRPLGLDAKRNA